MKLIEKLAKELPGWPGDAKYIRQDIAGNIYAYDECGRCFLIMRCDEMTQDGEHARVTRAMYEAEKAMILMESQPERDPFISELVEIACGKRSQEDQALWDKVATDLFVRWSMEYDSENDRKETIKNAMASADAFMAERAKRMK